MFLTSFVRQTLLDIFKQGFFYLKAKRLTLNFEFNTFSRTICSRERDLASFL